MKKHLLGVSIFTITSLYVLLSIIVIFVGSIFGLKLSTILLVSILVLIVQLLVAPFFTDLSMKWIYKAKFDYQLPEYLQKFISSVCQTNNMKYPKIGYIDDGSPNAFTYGRTKNDTRIVLTRGIFETLNEDEIKAVVGHELGHATHYDTLFMTAAQLVPLVLYYTYSILVDNDSSSSDDDSSSLTALGYIAYILYIISEYIVLWLSRTREYYADDFSIKVTKNPTALGNALVKVGYGLTTHTTKSGKMSVSKTNALGIMDAKTSKSLIASSYDDGKISTENIEKAMRWEKWNVWAKWYEIHSTHPMISKRLEAISAECKEYGQPPYIVFNEKPPESYVDDFLGEALLIFLPIILVICWIIVTSLHFSLPENKILTFIFKIWPSLILLSFLIRYLKSHKNKNYQNKKVVDLLSEVKVSGVTTIPCIIEGTVIGRGDPGSIFDEDFVLKDDTGIVFIDYKRVLKILDLIDATTKTKTLFGKKVTIKGWYRRAPVPYVEIHEMQVEGYSNKVFKNYALNIGLTITVAIAALIIGIIFFK